MRPERRLKRGLAGAVNAAPGAVNAAPQSTQSAQERLNPGVARAKPPMIHEPQKLLTNGGESCTGSFVK